MRALLVLAVVPLLSPSAAHAETLAEAASRETARRQETASKKAPVYTAGELWRPINGGTYNPMTGPAEKEGSRPRSAATTAGFVQPILRADADAPDVRGGSSEREWRARARSVHTEILAVSAEIAVLEKNPGGMAERKLVCPDGNPQCWNPKRASLSPWEQLVQARRRLAACQEALVALEDEARRHSVPPGWLR
jgi:hypothetical protein